MPQSPFINIKSGLPVINPGALRHRITLTDLRETSPPIVDASGIRREWTPVLTSVRAAISLYAGKELAEPTAGQTSSLTYIIVVMWYQPGVTPAMQVQSSNGTYKIRNIENVLEMNRVLELMCIAVGANQ